MRMRRGRSLLKWIRMALMAALGMMGLAMVRWVLVPPDLYSDGLESAGEPRMLQSRGGGLGRDLRHKDVAFDTDALREADPARDKVLQIVNDQTRQQRLGSGNANHQRHPLIPHILHQTWDSHLIPARFVPWVRSWVELHPDWELWLWTPDAVRCMLDMHFPDFRIYYDEYPDDISRADMMRYFVLYQYGGFYVDLDTKALKSLNPWTYSHQCLLSHEPYEHPYLVREENRSNVVNSPMASRPRHPFFQYVIKAIPEFASRYFGDFLHSTGPFFLDEIYQRYSRLPKPAHDNVTVLHPRYFLPTYDPSQTGIMDAKCDIHTYRKLPPLQRKVCEDLIDRDYKNVPYEESYMDHFWIHVNTFDPAWKTRDTVSIFDLVPKMKNLTSVMCDKFSQLADI